MWASGVLLFVLLLGAFPFEMSDESYVDPAGGWVPEEMKPHDTHSHSHIFLILAVLPGPAPPQSGLF